MASFLLPRERIRLDNKRKAQEMKQDTVSSEPPPPGYSPSSSEPPPPGYSPDQPPPPGYSPPLPPTALSHPLVFHPSQPPPPGAPLPHFPVYPHPPVVPSSSEPLPPGYPSPPPPSQQQNPNMAFPPFPIMNPMLLSPHPPPIKNQAFFPPHFSPQQPFNSHLKPSPQTLPLRFQHKQKAFPQKTTPPSPYPPPSTTPSNTTATLATPSRHTPYPTPSLTPSLPPSTSLTHIPLPPPSTTPLTSSTPTRRIPEFAVVLAEALRNGITDARTIYGLLRASYDQMRKEPREENSEEKEVINDVDECDERMLQEMMHLMSEIPLSPAVAQRPQPLMRGVIPGAGELMNSDCDVIIHCCNCYHKMGAGIAKSISEKYPSVAEADRLSPKDRGKLGHFTSALTADGKTFINLYAQYHYGYNDGQRKLSYKALRLGLMRVADRLRAQNTFPKVGSYYMGCYHAGGDKEKVKQIFNEVFYDRPIYIFSQITFTDPSRQVTNKFYDYNKIIPNLEATQNPSFLPDYNNFNNNFNNLINFNNSNDFNYSNFNNLENGTNYKEQLSSNNGIMENTNQY